MSDTITIQEINTELTLEVSETEVSISSEPLVELCIQETPVNLEILQGLVHNIDVSGQVETEVIEIAQGTVGPQGPAGVSGTTVQAIAGEAISALKIVRSINATEIVKADSTTVFEEARTLGMSITSGALGALIDVIFFGTISDASFLYPVNDPLFLTQDGDISNVQDPLSVYNSTIGYSLGVGAIFINLQEPILL